MFTINEVSKIETLQSHYAYLEHKEHFGTRLSHFLFRALHELHANCKDIEVKVRIKIELSLCRDYFDGGSLRIIRKDLCGGMRTTPQGQRPPDLAGPQLCSAKMTRLSNQNIAPSQDSNPVKNLII